MSRYDVANLKVRLGEWKIKQRGETQLFETKAARVVRHKEFTQQTLVSNLNHIDSIRRDKVFLKKKVI